MAAINPLLNCVLPASLAKDKSEKAHISSGGMLFLHVDIETYCFAIPAETHTAVKPVFACYFGLQTSNITAEKAK